VTGSFLLDSNIFIEANRVTYPLEVFPGFWEWLDQQNKAGIVKSIRPIYEELVAGDDELAEWVKKRNSQAWFLNVDDDETQLAYAEIVNLVMAQDKKYKEAVRTDFLGVADPWLIAKAMTLNAQIVTHESNDTNNKKKVLIPVVASFFNVKTISTMDLMRLTGVRFGLS
jgi:hypothetical protein